MSKLTTFPIAMGVAGKQVIIVGGGEMAAAKGRLILKTKALLTMISPTFDAQALALASNGNVTLIHRGFLPTDLTGATLVFAAATPAVNEDVAEAARARGIPVNTVDNKALCDFYTPAIVDRAPISIAISTEGEAPVLARMIRAKLETIVTPSLGRLAFLAGALREQVMKRLPPGPMRRRYLEALLSSPSVEARVSQDPLGAKTEALKLLDEHAKRSRQGGLKAGFVWLIGAGPGAGDLLTLRALRALQEADVIVYDSLVGNDVVDLARRDAMRIFVGKRKGAHSRTQNEINHILRSHASQGLKVARLKGGDPSIYGRIGEEQRALKDAGIAFAVIPGVTAALAAAAETKTPLTLRNVSSTLVLATGHGADDQEATDWTALAKSGATIAVYMGKSRAGKIAAQLVQAGLSPHTPIGIVENASYPDAGRFFGTLKDLDSFARRIASEKPALILIGDAVAHGDWQQALNLSGEFVTAA